MACSVVAVRLDELSLYLTSLQTIIMSFVIKKEGLPNLSDRGSRWGTTVCVFINKIGWILSEFGICGTFGSTTYPMIQERFTNSKISRLNRKFKIMFPSHYLTFGTDKNHTAKKTVIGTYASSYLTWSATKQMKRPTDLCCYFAGSCFTHFSSQIT